METLEKQIELMLGLKRGAWMESCLLSQSKCDIKQIYSLCRFNQMIQYDTDGGENVTSAIIKFTIRILDAYGIEINEFHHKSSNDLYLNFTLLARAFLEDLFKVILISLIIRLFYPSETKSNLFCSLKAFKRSSRDDFEPIFEQMFWVIRQESSLYK